jgi:hypothetical protein
MDGCRGLGRQGRVQPPEAAIRAASWLREALSQLVDYALFAEKLVATA